MGLKRVGAYAAIYVLWGGSYLAIRIVVAVVPPFFAAGVRYGLGGLILMALSVAVRHEPMPGWKPALTAILTGNALLALSYGVVYWAETRLDSWIVAVLVSTILPWTYVGEWLVLRRRKLTLTALLSVLAGLAGMPLLLNATLKEGQRESLLAAAAVVLGSGLWAATTLMLKRLELPRSSVQTAALQLVSAGITLLCISRLCGEPGGMAAMQPMLAARPLLGMAYLVLGSSVLGFTAFNWLLAHESVSLVATSAYVNPVVAMLLGILLAHEAWSPTQLLGGVIILGSVVLIWSLQTGIKPRQVVQEEKYGNAEEDREAA